MLGAEGANADGETALMLRPVTTEIFRLFKAVTLLPVQTFQRRARSSEQPPLDVGCRGESNAAEDGEDSFVEAQMKARAQIHRWPSQ